MSGAIISENSLPMSQTPTAPPPTEPGSDSISAGPAPSADQGKSSVRQVMTKVLLTNLLGGAALLLGGGAYSYLASLEKPLEAREIVDKVYVVEVFDVQPTDLQEIISGFGTARADREVVIAAQVAGEVQSVHPQLEIGKGVRPTGESQSEPGDLLLRIDPETYIERVQQAERRIAESEAELERLQREEANNQIQLEEAKEDVDIYRREHDRLQNLRQKGVASESDLTRTRLELQRYETALMTAEHSLELFPFRGKQIERRIETARSDLELARLDLNRTEIKPPFAGVLSDVMVEQGQYVSPGEPLVRLTDNTRVEIPVSVTLKQHAEIERRVRSGDEPSVDLAENETAKPRWSGQVVRVAPTADELTRTVDVFVEVDNERQPDPLLPGTFVHARISGPVLKNAVVVPRDALMNGNLYVVSSKAENGATAENTTGGDSGADAGESSSVAEWRKVEVRRTLQSLAVVTGELHADEYVILTNLDVIENGSHVKVETHRTLQQELEGQRVQSARQLAADEGEEQLQPLN